VITPGTVIEKTTHQFGEWVTVEATCTEYGSRTRTCAICGEADIVELPVLGHQVVTDKAVAATCTAVGLTEGSHCSRCNLILVAQEEITILGHNYIAVVTEPTCTKVGFTTHTCEYCRDSYVDNYTEKVAHVEGTPATCTNAAICANCGRSYGEALGHTYVFSDELSTPATCIAVGTDVYKCTRCGDTYSKQTALAAHSFSESDIVVVRATCTEEGYGYAVCTVCGETITIGTEPALGHHYENGVCTNCGEADPGYTPDTPVTPGSEKCEKCGLNHNGRTGLWKQDGFFCKIIGFFRNLFKVFSR
jgi:hypothetical protein